MELRFVVDAPPKSWSRARGANGKRFTDSKMRMAKALVAAAAREALGSRPPLEGPVALLVDANQRRKETSTPDADNLGKLVADALNGVVYADDSQVVDFRVRKTDVRRDDKDAEAWTGVTVVPVRWERDRGWVPRGDNQ